MNKKAITQELKNAWQIALLKKPAMHHVTEDKKKTVYGYYIIIAGAVLAAIGQQLFSTFFTPTLGMGIKIAIFQIIHTIVGIYVLSFVAKSIFKGSAKHDQFFRVAAYGMIVMWIGLIPNLSPIGGIWGLVILFVILKTIHKLTTGGAIGTFLVGIIVMLAISLILSPIYALMGLSGSKYINGYNFDKKEFKININDTETGSIKVDGGKMKITTPNGEVIEIDIPTN